MKRITASNFITDNRTDKVYISSLIDKPSGDLDKVVRGTLKSCIKQFANSEILYNTRDVWARDYMPIQLTHDIYLSYTYKPDYLHDYPQCVTNWQVHHVHSQSQYAKGEHFDFKVIQIPLILDGGNVVKAIVNNKPCFIMCDKVLQENNVNYNEFQIWWKNWWKDNFDGTEMGIVLLPWEGIKDNPIGHADGMVRYISEGQVLMTNYLDFDKKYGGKYGCHMKEELEKGGFTVYALHFSDKFDCSTDPSFCALFDNTWCYINYLQVGNKILLPSLGYESLDEEAKRQIDEVFNIETHTTDIQLIDVSMVAIVDDMGKGYNSGGALNCLTWTIQEN